MVENKHIKKVSILCKQLFSYTIKDSQMCELESKGLGSQPCWLCYSTATFEIHGQKKNAQQIKINIAIFLKVFLNSFYGFFKTSFSFFFKTLFRFFEDFGYRSSPLFKNWAKKMFLGLQMRQK